jgi:hypothetical protein
MCDCPLPPCKATRFFASACESEKTVKDTSEVQFFQIRNLLDKSAKYNLMVSTGIARCCFLQVCDFKLALHKSLQLV